MAILSSTPALADVGAARLLTDRVQLELSELVLDGQVLLPTRHRGALHPVRLPHFLLEECAQKIDADGLVSRPFQAFFGNFSGIMKHCSATTARSTNARTQATFMAKEERDGTAGASMSRDCFRHS